MPHQSLSNRRFIFVTSQQFVGTMLKIMTGVVLARMLSTARFGEFNAAYGVMMIASVLAGLGLNQFIVVPFRHAISSEDFSVARGLGRFTPLCILGAAAVSYGILLVAHVQFEHHSTVEIESFSTVLVLLPLVAMRSYLTSTANTHGAAGRTDLLPTSWSKRNVIFFRFLYFRRRTLSCLALATRIPPTSNARCPGAGLEGSSTALREALCRISRLSYQTSQIFVPWFRPESGTASEPAWKKFQYWVYNLPW